jgi:uncharacterized RDD family membrane protein YckC
MSVAPPGWVAPARTVLEPTTPVVAIAAAQAPTEAALRWRWRAASLDSLISGALYGVLCLLLHWSSLTPSHLVALLVIEVLYHIALESRDGQTIGKRRYGVRVVALDGGPACVKAIALRSVLRPIDRLPAWYTSAIVSLLRTGPSRRQRIGDVAAGTIVIAAGGRAAQRGTPSWMLPVATIVSLVLSVLFLYQVSEAGSRPMSAVQNAEWVAGCDRTAQGLFDCQCALTRLESAGYTSLNALRDLDARAREEELAGTPGTAAAALRAAILPCRR